MKKFIRLGKPAKSWDEGLPLGNGRLGMMLTGSVHEDVIPLNEETVWHGGPRDRTNKDAADWVDKIRQLLLDGRVEEAEYKSRMAFSSCPKYLMPYIPLGNLRLTFPGHTAYENYSRVLDLDNACAAVSYRIKGVEYTRTAWVSKEPNAIAMHINASRKGCLNFSAHLERRPFEENSGILSGESIQAIYGRCGDGGVRYYCAMGICSKGGKVYALGDFLAVEDADEAFIYISASTDFNEHERYIEDTVSAVRNAMNAEYGILWSKHLEWYRRLFNRVNLDINDLELPDKATDSLLEELRNTGDKNLMDVLSVLLFHFGRYLLISCSTDCQLPATLQGIWNGTYQPPWESKYTININTQMNYWPAEVCSLPECHETLFDLVDRMVMRGKETAEKIYGCRGFVAHHNTDIWANTDPESITSSALLWPMSGAWFSLHYYEHYLYTLDKEFLRERAIPVMRESLRFFDDYLYRCPDGTLMTGPSLSPENTYRTGDGQQASVCMSPTMDNQILRELCKAYRKACEIIGIRDEIYGRAKIIYDSLPPTRIGPDGTIMEWQEPYEEPEIGHRHMSHLFGVYPGTEIDESLPEKQEATKRTIEKRLSAGGGHTGWSRAWIICLYARLNDSIKFYENISAMLKKSIMINLLDTHPPFQIDGNFGFTAGVAEALLHSNNDRIDLLPACPEHWETGRVEGLTARGGINVTIGWTKNRVVATLVSKEDRCIWISCRGAMLKADLKAGIANTMTIA